ncbi:MAG: tRNA (guanosine(46)-N7)-methyltransferase TrmB [Porphyromonas sp.]|nr:tRNA (guanosine(46)-N7)-methyltransferase TrmB [Porphyromonas sp.]
MSKGKLEKFAELDRLSNVFQYPYARLIGEGVDFPHRGRWGSDVFGNDHPIVLELGCGRGEYTVGLARSFPQTNFVGIDIKGNRMWSGAKSAHEEGLENVRFLRTQIELIDHFFAPGEVSEVWLTFPDPQMKKLRRRLTSVGFLEQYRRLTGGGLLHLKTDSNFLYLYTLAVAEANQLTLREHHADVYMETDEGSLLQRVKTYYEQQWLERGMTIKYLQIELRPQDKVLVEPDVEIERDDYRSFGRSRRV